MWSWLKPRKSFFQALPLFSSGQKHTYNLDLSDVRLELLHAGPDLHSVVQEQRSQDILMIVKQDGLANEPPKQVLLRSSRLKCTQVWG